MFEFVLGFVVLFGLGLGEDLGLVWSGLGLRFGFGFVLELKSMLRFW